MWVRGDWEREVVERKKGEKGWDQEDEKEE